MPVHASWRAEDQEWSVSASQIYAPGLWIAAGHANTEETRRWTTKPLTDQEFNSAWKNIHDTGLSSFDFRGSTMEN